MSEWAHMWSHNYTGTYNACSSTQHITLQGSLGWFVHFQNSISLSIISYCSFDMCLNYYSSFWPWKMNSSTICIVVIININIDVIVIIIISFKSVYSCPISYIGCATTRKCINRIDICNGRRDCLDNSDEDICNVSNCNFGTYAIVDTIRCLENGKFGKTGKYTSCE